VLDFVDGDVDLDLVDCALTISPRTGVALGWLGRRGCLARRLRIRARSRRGHGGILDRVDALMVTSTVLYLYTRCVL
jgi:hypothetical protein